MPPLYSPGTCAAYHPHDKTVPAEIRFWSSTLITDKCWLWRPSIKNGMRGQIKDNKVRMYAYVYSWKLHYGPVPEGLLVCHHCDNPICVRPDHLFVGTYSDNAQDCISKGRRNDEARGKKGIEHHLAKVSDEDIRFIRKHCIAGARWPDPGSSRYLAKMFKMSARQIRNIATSSQWSHVT